MARLWWRRHDDRRQIRPEPRSARDKPRAVQGRGSALRQGSARRGHRVVRTAFPGRAFGAFRPATTSCRADQPGHRYGRHRSTDPPIRVDLPIRPGRSADPTGSACRSSRSGHADTDPAGPQRSTDTNTSGAAGTVRGGQNPVLHSAGRKSRHARVPREGRNTELTRVTARVRGGAAEMVDRHRPVPGRRGPAEVRTG